MQLRAQTGLTVFFGILAALTVGAFLYFGIYTFIMMQALSSWGGRSEFPAPLRDLAHAACQGDLDGIARAHARGADPNGMGVYHVDGNDHPETILIATLRCDSPKGIEALLKIGANPNKPNDVGTPVLLAAGDQNQAVLQLLLAHGGDPNASQDPRLSDDWALNRAFIQGAMFKQWGNYDLLLRAGADLNGEHDEVTIGSLAARHHRFDRLEYLLQHGFNHDLERVASIMADKPETLPQDQAAARDRVIVLLKERGLAWPFPSPKEYYSGSVRLWDDHSLSVEWNAGRREPDGSTSAFVYTLHPDQPEYASLLARTGKLIPGQSKSLVRQLGDPK